MGIAFSYTHTHLRLMKLQEEEDDAAKMFTESHFPVL